MTRHTTTIQFMFDVKRIRKCHQTKNNTIMNNTYIRTHVCMVSPRKNLKNLIKKNRTCELLLLVTMMLQREADTSMEFLHLNHLQNVVWFLLHQNEFVFHYLNTHIQMQIQTHWQSTTYLNTVSHVLFYIHIHIEWFIWLRVCVCVKYILREGVVFRRSIGGMFSSNDAFTIIMMMLKLIDVNGIEISKSWNV